MSPVEAGGLRVLSRDALARSVPDRLALHGIPTALDGALNEKQRSVIGSGQCWTIGDCASWGLDTLSSWGEALTEFIAQETPVE